MKKEEKNIIEYLLIKVLKNTTVGKMEINRSIYLRRMIMEEKKKRRIQKRKKKQK
jgi:hypothetical protein